MQRGPPLLATIQRIGPPARGASRSPRRAACPVRPGAYSGATMLTYRDAAALLRGTAFDGSYAQLADELADLGFYKLIGFPPKRGGAVHTTKSTTQSLLSRFQIAAPLQRMKHWVERARAQRVAMTGELVNHPLAV